MIRLQQSIEISIPVGKTNLEGSLNIPEDASGVVLFAHGSGSSRFSPRNRYVAQELNDFGIATLLFDLLTKEEEEIDMYTAQFRFDIELLAERLMGATERIVQNDNTHEMKVGYFGASTGTAAALIAASEMPHLVSAIVSRGGRPDLATYALPLVKAPTLLIVGGNDAPVIEMNRDALSRLNTIKEMKIVPGATHLFEEPGTLEEVAKLATQWFNQYLNPMGG